MKFLPGARKEFLEAVQRYESKLAGLGGDFLAEVEAAWRRARAFPESSPSYLEGTRRIVLRRFPFSVVYSWEQEVLVVVAIPHHRQRPGYWLDRLRHRR